MSVSDLTIAFNAKFKSDKTLTQIKNTLNNHKMLCGRKQGELIKGRSFLFTNEQVEFIKKHYPLHDRNELIKMLNEQFKTDFKLSQLITFVRNHKIKCGRTGYFNKGQKAWNSGTKGLTGANKTSFKKGHVRKQLPIGAERFSADGYYEIKIKQPNVWALKHRVIWKEAHGDIPTGMVVIFVDSNPRNCQLSNLELISRAILLRLIKNKYSHVPNEFKPAIKALSEMEVKMFERIK